MSALLMSSKIDFEVNYKICVVLVVSHSGCLRCRPCFLLHVIFTTRQLSVPLSDRIKKLVKKWLFVCAYLTT